MDWSHARNVEKVDQKLDLSLVFFVYQFEVVIKSVRQAGLNKVRLSKIVKAFFEESVLEVFLLSD